MTKTETVIRSIFGAAGIDTRPLARAVDIAAELLFTHRQTIDELHFTRDIYSPVAVLLRGKNGEPQSVKTISKSIERLSNQCWDILVARGLVGKYIGAEISDIHAPRDIIIYLAFSAISASPSSPPWNRSPPCTGEMGAAERRRRRGAAIGPPLSIPGLPHRRGRNGRSSASLP